MKKTNLKSIQSVVSKSLLSLILCLILAPSAHAITFVGELVTSSLPPGMVGSGIWEDNFKLGWEVESVGSDWKYTYSLTELNGDPLDPGAVSHLIFEVSADILSDDLSDNFWNFTADGVAVSSSKLSIDDFAPGGSNPNMPGVLHGLKVDIGDASEYSFFSTRDPVWGDFYAKDGKAGSGPVKEDNAIWNADFLSADPTDPAQNGLLSKPGGGFYYKALRPDTSTGGGTPPGPEIPEPSTVIMIGLGSLVAFFRRKK